MALFARQSNRANLFYFTHNLCPSFCLALVHRSRAFGNGKPAWILESQVMGCQQEVCTKHALAFPRLSAWTQNTRLHSASSMGGGLWTLSSGDQSAGRRVWKTWVLILDGDSSLSPDDVWV